MGRIKKVLVCLLVFVVTVTAISGATAIDLPLVEDLAGHPELSVSALSSNQDASKQFLNPKMDSAMNRVVSEYKTRGQMKILNAGDKKARITIKTPGNKDGRVIAYLDLEDKESVRDLQAKYDLSNIITTNFSETVQANVLVRDLERLAREDLVNYIREPSIAATNIMPDVEDVSSVMESKAVAEIQADKFHKMGIIGNYTETAVIDLGFYRYLNNPEINNIKEVKSFRSDLGISPGNQAHGTIVSEVYSDICYGNLSFYTVCTDIEFASAVEHIIERGDIRVLFSSLAFLGGMPRETSITSKAVDKARDNGIIPVISAGNYGKRYYESKFVDTDGDGWHEFNVAGEKIDETQKLGLVEKNEHFGLFLSWIDANQDLDLYVIQEAAQMSIIGFSYGRQIGIEPAVEGITITMNSDGYLHAAVHSSSEDSVTNSTNLELFAGIDLQYISLNSVTSPAAAKGAISVGAVEPGSREIQDYSSCGNVSFVGISPVITWVTEPFLFDGTSASTPSVAGAFALLISAYPTATNEQVLRAIRETAIDLGEPGYDLIYGWGLPQVYDAYQRLKEILENQ